MATAVDRLKMSSNIIASPKQLKAWCGKKTSEIHFSVTTWFLVQNAFVVGLPNRWGDADGVAYPGLTGGWEAQRGRQ
jgi:hypothetical protein